MVVGGNACVRPDRRQGCGRQLAYRQRGGSEHQRRIGAGACARGDRHVERPVRAALDSLRREPDGQSRCRPQGALPVRGGLTTKLRRDARGTTLVEFALASPILIMFMLAVMQIGMTMQAYSALREVIGSGGRAAMVEIGREWGGERVCQYV